MAGRRIKNPRAGDFAVTANKGELPIIAVTDRGTVWVEDEGQERALFPSHIRARKIVFIRKG